MENTEEAIQEEMEEQAEDDAEDNLEEQMELSQEMQEAYGSPQQDEKHNQHTFLHKAAFSSGDTVRTTFLAEGELGRPIFTVRFLMDMEDISMYYLNPLLKELNLEPTENNAIANYFFQKLQNITASGMSNKGFAMNLNVTQKRDSTKQKIRNIQNLKNQKGGKM